MMNDANNENAFCATMNRGHGFRDYIVYSVHGRRNYVLTFQTIRDAQYGYRSTELAVDWSESDTGPQTMEKPGTL